MFTPELLRAKFAARDAFDWAGDWPLHAEQAPAAVLLPLFPSPDGVSVLLTRRTDHLQHHAGQISFPGGRLEEGDESPVAAALRETWEETGICVGEPELLGVLPEFGTPSGFRITPVVALLAAPPALRLAEYEVAEAFEVPLEFLLRPANYQRHRIVWQQGERHVWAVPYAGRFIWGATAGILHMLARFLDEV